MLYGIILGVLTSVFVLSVFVAPPFALAAFLRLVLPNVCERFIAMLSASASLVLFLITFNSIRGLDALRLQMEYSEMIGMLIAFARPALGLAVLYMFAEWGIDMADFIRSKRQAQTKELQQHPIAASCGKG